MKLSKHILEMLWLNEKKNFENGRKSTQISETLSQNPDFTLFAHCNLKEST